MTIGTAKFLGYVDLPLFTPSWAPVSQLETYTDTKLGWKFAQQNFVPMPYTSPQFHSPNLALVRFLAMSFDFVQGARELSLNPTSVNDSSMQGMNYWDSRIHYYSTTNNCSYFQEPFNPFAPNTFYAAPGPWRHANVGNINLFDPMLVRTATGVGGSAFAVRIFTGVSGEPDPIHVMTWDPLTDTLYHNWEIATHMQFYANGAVWSNNFPTYFPSLPVNRTYKGKTALGGDADFIRWTEDVPSSAEHYVPSFDNSTLNAFVTGTGSYDVGVAQNAFVWVFETGGTGPTGQRSEVAFVDLDMTSYVLARFHPLDTRAAAEISRTSNTAWSVKIDARGVVWFNSGHFLDAAYPLVSLGQLPQILPLPGPGVIDLPCFQPCPPIP